MERFKTMRDSVSDATIQAKHNGDQDFYLVNAVAKILGRLTADELVELLLVAETNANYKECLSFASEVKSLFTVSEILEREPTFMHESVRNAVRGYCAVRLEFV